MVVVVGRIGWGMGWWGGGVGWWMVCPGMIICAYIHMYNSRYSYSYHYVFGSGSGSGSGSCVWIEIYPFFLFL